MRHKVILFLALIFIGQTAQSQIDKNAQIAFDRLPSQVSVIGLYTRTDYTFQYESGSTERAMLTGVQGEYAWRRYYPWQAVASIRYGHGDLLSQTLFGAMAGAGYIRTFNRVTPYANLQLGISRTASDRTMYLYKTARTGFSETLSAGADYQLTPRWAVRPFQIQNQYMPFGSKHSVYWEIGAGASYRFLTHHRED